MSNIYLIKQKAEEPSCKGKYYSFVCIAKDLQEALKYHPNGLYIWDNYHWVEKEDDYYTEEVGFDTWVKNPFNDLIGAFLGVYEIGDNKRGVICSQMCGRT